MHLCGMCYIIRLSEYNDWINAAMTSMLEQISPHIRLAWYSVLQPGTYIKERVLFDYELLYIKSGGAEITIGDATYTGAQGDLFIFRPGQRHSIRIADEAPFVQPHIHFDLFSYPDRSEVPISFKNMSEMSADEMRYFRRDDCEAFISPFPSLLRPQSPLYIEQLIFDVIHAYNNPGLFPEITLKWLFLRLWVQLLSEIACQRDLPREQKSEAVRKVKLYLEHNVDRRITLDELARANHFSKSYLSRLFKEAYQTSPLHYHTTLRIQKAKDLVRFTNMPLTEIASLMAFENLQDFSRVFRKLEGVPPSYYRQPAYLSQAQAYSPMVSHN